MRTEELTRELESIEDQYKDIKYGTFELCIDQMVHDCVQGFKTLQKENASLRSDLTRYQTAEAEGRLVELPCKVGDTVYDLAFGGYAFEITQIGLRMYDETWFRCGNKGTDDYMAFSLDDIGERISLVEPERKTNVSDGSASAAIKGVIK